MRHHSALTFTTLSTLLFLAACPVMVVHAMLSDRLFPFLGLIPLAGSAILSYSDISNPAVNLACDIVLSAELFAVLFGARREGYLWRNDGVQVLILGGYGLMLVAVGCAIHAIPAAKHLSALLTNRPCPSDCPYHRSTEQPSLLDIDCEIPGLAKVAVLDVYAVPASSEKDVLTLV